MPHKNDKQLLQSNNNLIGNLKWIGELYQKLALWPLHTRYDVHTLAELEQSLINTLEMVKEYRMMHLTKSGWIDDS